jgi:hypothetical protein
MCTCVHTCPIYHLADGRFCIFHLFDIWRKFYRSTSGFVCLFVLLHAHMLYSLASSDPIPTPKMILSSTCVHSTRGRSFHAYAKLCVHVRAVAIVAA